MTKDFDILPPIEPGVKEPIEKKGFFSKLFHKQEQSLDLPPPPQEDSLVDKFEDPLETKIEEPVEDSKVDTTSKGLKVEDIRKKLGLINEEPVNEVEEVKDELKEDKFVPFVEDIPNDVPEKIPHDTDFAEEVPDKFAFETPSHDFSEDLDLEKPTKVEKIDNPAPAIKLKKGPKKAIKVVPIEEEFNIPAFELPQETYDEGIMNESTEVVDAHLSKLEKESKDLIKDVKDIVMQKKRKHLENVFLLPHKQHLTSIESLVKFAEDKEKYHTFKDSVLKNKQSFLAWVNSVLRIQKETEAALTKELYDKVKVLDEYYISKLNSIITKYKPVKVKQLNDLKQKENSLKEKIEYVTKYESNLKKEHIHLLHEKTKTKKLEENLKKQKEKLENDVKLLKEKLAKESEELRNKFELKEKERREFYDKKHDEFKHWTETQKKLTEEKQAKFEKESTKIKNDLLEVKNDYLNLRNVYDDKSKKIEPAIQHLHKEEEAFDNRKQLIGERLKEQENRVINKIHYNESILAALAKEKRDLELIKQEVEKGGFSNYLSKKLSNIPEDETVNIERDIQLRKSNIPSVNLNALNNLNDLMNECKSALENGEFTKTKQIYNDIRARFKQLELSKSEKQEIYTEIRELYDDINLKILEQEALRHI